MPNRLCCLAFRASGQHSVDCTLSNFGSKLPEILLKNDLAEQITKAAIEFGRKQALRVEHTVRRVTGLSSKEAHEAGWHLRSYSFDPKTNKPDVTYLLDSEDKPWARWWVTTENTVITFHIEEL